MKNIGESIVTKLSQFRRARMSMRRMKIWVIRKYRKANPWIWTSIWIGLAVWWSWFLYDGYRGRVGFPEVDKVNDLTAAWGQVGDFFGGVLNPLFGFLTLLMLLRSLEIDRQALQLSSEELRMSRRELRRSADANKAQLKHLEVQARKTELIRLMEAVSERIHTATRFELILSKNDVMNYYDHAPLSFRVQVDTTTTLEALTFCCDNLRWLDDVPPGRHPTAKRQLVFAAGNILLLTELLHRYKALPLSDDTVWLYWIEHCHFAQMMLDVSYLRPLISAQGGNAVDDYVAFWNNSPLAGGYTFTKRA